MVVSQGLSWGIPVTKCYQSHATDHINQAAHSKGENALHHVLRKAATSGPKNLQQRLQQHLVTNLRGPTTSMSCQPELGFMALALQRGRILTRTQMDLA